MTEEDFPALYQAADSASLAAQTAYLRCIRGYAAIAIVGAGLSTAGTDSRTSAIAAAIVLMGGLAISVFMALRRYEDIWYRTRAVAESIKTISWKFMMGAEPFHHAMPLQDARGQLSRLLNQILREHKHLGSALGGHVADRDQISQTMIAMRKLPLPDRITNYRRDRIEDQRKWYARKSQENARQGTTWFWALIILQSAAITFALLRIAYPEWRYWPIEVFVVAGASALGWIQVKRFRELAAAYAVTAHEIGLAAAGLPDDVNDDRFSQFVTDTENAFSREHTQWAARKEAAA